MDNQYNYYKPDENENNQTEGNGYQESGSYNYYQQEPPKPKKPFPKKAIAFGLAAVLIAGLSGAAFQGGSYLVGKMLPQEKVKTVGSVSDSQLTTMKTTVNSDISEIVENTMPSMVSITKTSVQQVVSWFGGISTIPRESAGSGIIISQNDSELLIVTNNHVVEGAETLTVTFCDESNIEAQIKGTDSSRDLAVIAIPINEIPEETLDNIKVAMIGDSNTLKMGSPVIAIGNALGYGQSVTNGIVSAVKRTIEGYEGDYIQTNAAINPGNSGGALLNANGELIGINSAKINDSSVEGMGFAIPISDVTDILENLMNRETRTKVIEEERGYLGIKGYDVAEEGVQMYNMPSGVFVAEVTEDGAAEKAGISKGSIITGFEGTSIRGMEELKEQLSYYRAGEEVELTVQIPEKNGEYTEENVTLILQKSES